jgi:hypothetical protein
MIGANVSLKRWGTMQPEEIKAYADEIAKRLGETEKKPVEQIHLLVEHAGKEFVEEHLAETIKIEENGGMLTDDKKRRRSIGGVFFYITKGKLDPEIRGRIFPGYGSKPVVGKIIKWDERLEHIKPLLDAAEHGDMRYVTMTFHGQVGKTVVDDNVVMTTIVHTFGQTPLPRGVPHPPEEGKTLYTVYMARKQWDDVTESLEKYKNDRIVVDGALFYDEATSSIAILASRVSTKRLDKQARRGEEDPNKPKEAKPQKDEAAAKQKSPKPPGQAKPGKPQRPAPAAPTRPPAPMKPMNIPQAKPQLEVAVPDNAPPDVADKLRQLHSAAETLRERINVMEQKGQAGVAMTKKLLQNTEKQIEALEKQFTE